VHAGLLGETEFMSVLWEAAQAAGKDDEREIDRIARFALDHASTAPLPDGIINA
jgi:hypothetical protein